MTPALASRVARICTVLALAVLMQLATGCVSSSVSCGMVPDVPVALHLLSSVPGDVDVRVIESPHVREASAYQVPAGGTLVFTVLRSGLHCVRDYGWYTSSDDEPDDALLLEFRRGDALVGSLTPRQLRELPLDDDGLHVLRLRR